MTIFAGKPQPPVMAARQHCETCGVGWVGLPEEVCWCCGGVAVKGEARLPARPYETYSGTANDTTEEVA